MQKGKLPTLLLVLLCFNPTILFWVSVSSISGA
ncbi:hypothetical protein RDI58_021605 [Solanum bulbocastanum]|uniref:Uncharacterized protein n=1 Tax=Solanum bulbocastanum TaxID=147425 RepID=A0AAN8T927_SOLBU